jgi:hypothetical protein
VLRDGLDPAGLPFDARIRDACDLHELIGLATGVDIEAVEDDASA